MSPPVRRIPSRWEWIEIHGAYRKDTVDAAGGWLQHTFKNRRFFTVLRKDGEMLMVARTTASVILLVMTMLCGIPEAIPATDPCGDIAVEFPARKIQKRDRVRSLSASSILRRMKDGREMLLVDVREAGAFAKFKIPGSINIPLHFVKVKPFLKKKTFILVNEGSRYGLLAEECRKLSETGFPCSALYGGLTAWRDEGGTLEGDHAAWMRLGDIPAAVFFLEKEMEGWFMIDTSRKRAALSACLLPDAVHVDVSGSPEQAVSRLGEAASRDRTDPFTRIIVFNEKGTDYDSVRFFAGKAGLKNVFYLEGGLEQYAAYLNQRRLAALPREGRLKTTAGCGSSCGGKR